jgi:hypothetical protein
MKLIGLALLLCIALSAIAQTARTPGGRQGRPDPLDIGNSVNWVRLDQPQYPPLARQARIQSVVRIGVRFIGCTLDPASVQLISGHPMLASAAMRSVKQSTIECGDHPNSEATLVYDFQLDSKCHDDRTTVRVDENRVTVRACVANPPPLN